MRDLDFFNKMKIKRELFKKRKVISKMVEKKQEEIMNGQCD